MAITLLAVLGAALTLAGAFIFHLGVFFMVIGLGLIRAASSLHEGAAS